MISDMNSDNNKNKRNWMSYNLRHNAKLLTDPSGWVSIETLAKLSPEVSLSTAKRIENIIKTVEKDKKTRFCISADGTLIRATNGHSVDLAKPIMTRVLSDNSIPWMVHATTNEAWVKIQEYGGLSRMSRDYVHFAIDFPHLRPFDIYLYLDSKSFIDDGNELWITSNNVIASMNDVPIRYLVAGPKPKQKPV